MYSFPIITIQHDYENENLSPKCRLMALLPPINESEVGPSSCVQPMVSPRQCLLFLLLHFVSGRYKVLFDSTLMLPMEEADDDMMRTISTGQIPDQLLQEILEEAGQFMDLFKHNPSSFLTRLAHSFKHWCILINLIIHK